MNHRISPWGALLAAASLLPACMLEVAEEDDLGTLEYALSASSAADRAALALRWAPIHRQDVDVTGSHALSGRADYLSRVDFDGDWSSVNNWENAASRALPAYGYHAVVETSTHWFINYLFYHPRDWSDSPFDTEHENDGEGVLMIVARDGSTYGALIGAVTVAHTDFFSFTPAGSPLGARNESIDGTLSFASHGGVPHPITAQEAKGHGLKAWPAYDIVGDGVIYYPSLTVAEEPSSATDSFVSYKLLDLFGAEGLWERRNLSTLFVGSGAFVGDRGGDCGSGVSFLCGVNSANAPWNWNDGNDGPIESGEIATDPAKLVAHYFTAPAGFSLAYTWNPFRNIGSAAAP
jgi:hypothetical protein